MESIPKKGYFAKELALKTLFGDKAFNDLKRLLDPCCGIGIDNICIAPCGSTPTDMCPTITITGVTINCVTGECNMTLVVENSGGAPISGFFQMQFTIPIPIPVPINFAFQIDSWTVVGDGTHTVQLPYTCLLFNDLDFGNDLVLSLANFYAYEVSGASSNLFPAANSTVYCPRLTMCDENLDSGKSCPNAICVDQTMYVEFNLQPDEDIQNPVTLQYCTNPNTGNTPNWVTFGTVTVVPGGGNQTFIIDASALPTNTCAVSIQAVDAQGVATIKQQDIDDEDMPVFCMPAPCENEVIISAVTAAKPGCSGFVYQQSIAFTYSGNGDYVYEVDFSGTGTYTIVHSYGALTGPGSVPLAPVSLAAVTAGGPYTGRIRETTGGSVSSTFSVTFPVCS